MLKCFFSFSKSDLENKIDDRDIGGPCSRDSVLCFFSFLIVAGSPTAEWYSGNSRSAGSATALGHSLSCLNFVFVLTSFMSKKSTAVYTQARLEPSLLSLRSC